jgi:hypothetical protein
LPRRRTSSNIFISSTSPAPAALRVGLRKTDWCRRPRSARSVKRARQLTPRSRRGGSARSIDQQPLPRDPRAILPRRHASHAELCHPAAMAAGHSNRGWFHGGAVTGSIAGVACLAWRGSSHNGRGQRSCRLVLAEAAPPSPEVRRMVEELAPRPATVDCRCGARTPATLARSRITGGSRARGKRPKQCAGLILPAGAGERRRRVLNAIDSTTPPSATVRHRAASASSGGLVCATAGRRR